MPTSLHNRPVPNDTQLNVEKIARNWEETSDDDFRVMQSLYQSKSYYWALFLGHLTIEKLLKALYVKKHKEHAPLIHNLYRLAKLNELELTPERVEWLVEVTSFNINARYDDDENEFRQKCTPAYTAEWVEKINHLQSWIKTLL
jgi:HEPN domain-containing protein